MNPAVEGIHRNAITHLQRATRLWSQSAEMLRKDRQTGSRQERIRKAAELNERAFAECQQALNSIDFLQKYQQTSN
jgi:hypothetical protein